MILIIVNNNAEKLFFDKLFEICSNKTDYEILNCKNSIHQIENHFLFKKVTDYDKIINLVNVRIIPTAIQTTIFKTIIPTKSILCWLLIVLLNNISNIGDCEDYVSKNYCRDVETFDEKITTILNTAFRSEIQNFFPISTNNTITNNCKFVSFLTAVNINGC